MAHLAMLIPRVTPQGTAMLFHPHAFPYGAIGPVRFLWRAAKEGGGLRDVLVLRCWRRASASDTATAGAHRPRRGQASGRRDARADR